MSTPKLPRIGTQARRVLELFLEWNNVVRTEHLANFRFHYTRAITELRAMGWKISCRAKPSRENQTYWLDAMQFQFLVETLKEEL